MRWGILAGEGLLPIEVAKGMREQDIEPIIICLSQQTEEFTKQGFAVIHKDAGQLGAILNYFHEHKVERLVLGGRVSKEALFTGEGLDQEWMILLSQLKEKTDDALQLAIVNYLQAKGITVEGQTRFLSHLTAEPGLLVGPELSQEEKEDVAFGYQKAKAIGRLDIGQSVVVKKGMIVAVEAIEGTDQTISRGGKYAGPGTVVVKAAKPQQDMRFDLPVIGMTTLQALVSAKTRVLAVQAGVTFFLEKEKFLAEAESHGISVVALDDLSIIDN